MEGVLRDVVGVLMGKDSRPSIQVTNFPTARMLVFVILYCFFERGIFLEFTQQLTSTHELLLPALFAIRTIIILLMVTIWLLKSEVASHIPYHRVTTSVIPHVLHLQSAALWLLTVVLSMQVTFDVFVVYPQRVGLSPHAIKTLTGLKQMAPFAFFIMRDTPISSLVPAWAAGILVSLANCLYAQDREQLAVLMFYAVGSVIIFSDTWKQSKTMTEMIVKLQNTLKENEELAVEAQALELRAMIGNVAHDLKTPLTSFLSGIECMTDMLTEWSRLIQDPDFQWTDESMARFRSTNKDLLACLQNMNGANSFMTMTINRCLDYTKASKGFKLVPTFDTVSLELKLNMTANMIRNAYPSIDINIKKIEEVVCSHIITDKQWLIENLLCLLSNAAKYSHKGHVDIAVALEKDGQHLRFEVQDTGVGLSDEAMQDLFKPFKQAQRLAGGTGLGLFSLAKRVEALQGTYGVMRRPDGEQGSLFWFTIPYRPDNTSSSVYKQRIISTELSSNEQMNAMMSGSVSCNSSYSAAQEPSCHVPQGPFNVLVVDDAPLIVKMTTMLLQRKGHTVQHAVNGADALQKLHIDSGTTSCIILPLGGTTESEAAPPFDVVLMDLQMPVLDGIEAIRRLRAAEGKQRGRAHTEVGAVSSFDVVLMDLQMPVLDGIEAIRRLRAAEARRDAILSSNFHEMDPSESPQRQFVIALSANSDEETRQEALMAGADMFLPKPFTYENFLDVINSHTN
eukprot:CAMPEP_0185012522 /NCGR_PEP_ID=MMETSP1098-20130426/98342_1 /TAXON_ID=89044 /ORGANISM="Spumella elongata, Strain CCAP 955/1" /LENGTH=736 /DNA_ID=CAMNT_0027541585 /DNA_START=130 /DNA_END=2340 /DNA_ORIENTATION=+